LCGAELPVGNEHRSKVSNEESERLSTVCNPIEKWGFFSIILNENVTYIKRCGELSFFEKIL